MAFESECKITALLHIRSRPFDKKCIFLRFAEFPNEKLRIFRII